MSLISSCAIPESCSVADDISSAEEAEFCVTSLTSSTALETWRAFVLCSFVAAEMLRLISLTFFKELDSSLTLVACWPTASESPPMVSFTFSDALRISSTAVREPSAIPTPSVTLRTLSRMSDAISFEEEAHRSASLLTSSATTAKPRPCSPARAASMEALRASRLVWSAMSEITLTIPPIFSELAAMRLMVATTCATAAAPRTALATEVLARSEISASCTETRSMDFSTCAIEAVPCCTAEAWLWACSETWSTEAVSSSTDALVSSRLDAWLCAPSASCWALAEISSEELATCSALCCTPATMSFNRSHMSLRARASRPISSLRST